MTTATILAFAGSARRDSWNRKVLAVAAVGAREAATIVKLG
jgi:NAD(P)H-dependent FMN reductase